MKKPYTFKIEIAEHPTLFGNDYAIERAKIAEILTRIAVNVRAAAPVPYEPITAPDGKLLATYEFGDGAASQHPVALFTIERAEPAWVQPEDASNSVESDPERFSLTPFTYAQRQAWPDKAGRRRSAGATKAHAEQAALEEG